MSENTIEAVNSDMSDEPANHDREIPALRKRKNRAGGILLLAIGVLVIYLAVRNAVDEETEKTKVITVAEQQATNKAYEITSVPVYSLPDPAPVVVEPPAPVEAAPLLPGSSGAKPELPEVDPKEEEARLAKIDAMWKRKYSGPVVKKHNQPGGTGGFIKTGGSTGNPYDDQILALTNRGQQLQAELSGLQPNQNRGSDARTAQPVMGVANSAATANASPLPDPGYTIVEGKVIGAILETAIQSDAKGKLRALSTEPVYSYDGSRILIPQGSRFIGVYTAGMKQGKTRLFAIWNRAITPDNVSISLESPGIGPLGRAGMSGYLDTHFWERFGASLMLSIIGSAVSDTTDNRIRSVGQDFKSTAEIALENSIDIPPTFHKNHGESIRIFVAQDINFRGLYGG